MTAAEVYELTTSIDGFAVNCFVEPVYTLDADLVLVASAVGSAVGLFTLHGFGVQHFAAR